VLWSVGFPPFGAKRFRGSCKSLGCRGTRSPQNLLITFRGALGAGVPDGPTPNGGARLFEMLQASPEIVDLPFSDEPYKTALETAAFLDGMPRYPKMHPCGVVLVAPAGCATHLATFVATRVIRRGIWIWISVEAVWLVKMDIPGSRRLGGNARCDPCSWNGNEIDVDRCVARDRQSGDVLLGDHQAVERVAGPQVWEMIASGTPAQSSYRKAPV